MSPALMLALRTSIGSMHRSGAASVLARNLVTRLNGARNYSYAMRQGAVDTVRQLLGPRIPNDVSLIDTDDGADIVRYTPAAAVFAPTVQATKAG